MTISKAKALEEYETAIRNTKIPGRKKGCS